MGAGAWVVPGPRACSGGWWMGGGLRGGFKTQADGARELQGPQGSSAGRWKGRWVGFNTEGCGVGKLQEYH